MIEYNAALQLMKKYGYSSTTRPPYLYRSLQYMGVYYRYYDRDYGILERIKIFDSSEAMENFLSRLRFLEDNGVKNQVRMILDNYEIANPKNIFLHQDKTMEKGEMFQLSSYEQKRKEEDLLDQVSKLILEAGRMLVYYDEVKNKRLSLSKSVLELENELRKRYILLQKEIDRYNGIAIKREEKLLPILEDTDGINIILENSLKEIYSQYKVTPPSLEEALQLIKEIWTLLFNLEEYPKYFFLLQRERELYNELRVVQAKMDLMLELNHKNRGLFAVHLMEEFRKINRFYKLRNFPIEKDFEKKEVKAIEKKYASFEKLDILSLSDYLKESVGNSNYGELLYTYSKDKKGQEKSFLTPKQISSKLLDVYKNSLSVEEQAILLLYHSLYKELLDYLLQIPDLFEKSAVSIAKEILKNKRMRTFKKQCYDGVKYHLNNHLNASIKKSVFKDIDFTTFVTFIQSLIHSLSLLKNINNKMRLEGNLVMYTSLDTISSLPSKSYLYIKQDLSSVQKEIKEKDEVIAILTLKKDTPVIFCPYHLDLGNVSARKEETFQIVYMKEFNLFIDLDDVIIERDANMTGVSYYEPSLRVMDGITVVEKVKLNTYYQFIKMFLYSRFNDTKVKEEREKE